MPSMYLPGGKARTEKYIRAEQKNRLERTRLDHSQKFFDREAYKTKSRIEREKKLLTKAHELVKRTSGLSDEGCPPLGTNDREYEKSIVFQNGLRLTDLRLNNWRSHEKELTKFLENVERDMEKKEPLKSMKVKFANDINSKGNSRKRPSVKSNELPNRPKSSNAVSKGSSLSSYPCFSEEEVDSDDSSIYTDESSQFTQRSCSGFSKTNTPRQKRVTFARPHSSGSLLRRKINKPDKKNAEETTHFLITKGGVLMNTDGEYRRIKPASAPSRTSRERCIDKSVAIGGRQMMLQRLLSEGELSTSSVESFRLDESPGRHLFSPCSESSSVGFYVTDTHNTRCAPSPIGNLPMRTNVQLGRPNSRLGIFLPPEREFHKREHFSSRRQNDSTSDYQTQQTPGGPSGPWKSRLVFNQSSHAHIRSLSSMATVMRAALAFSKTRRQKVLKEILNEKETEDRIIAEEEKKKRDEFFKKAPNIEDHLKTACF